jgi:RimJ/RimL family protein N-acetyltransferase
MRIARTLGHRRLTAGHFTDNPASGRVLRKLGFHHSDGALCNGRLGDRFRRGFVLIRRVVHGFIYLLS